jgi:hypothetical protein
VRRHAPRRESRCRRRPASLPSQGPWHVPHQSAAYRARGSAFGRLRYDDIGGMRHTPLPHGSGMSAFLRRQPSDRRDGSAWRSRVPPALSYRDFGNCPMTVTAALAAEPGRRQRPLATPPGPGLRDLCLSTSNARNLRSGTASRRCGHPRQGACAMRCSARVAFWHMTKSHDFGVGLWTCASVVCDSAREATLRAGRSTFDEHHTA